MRDTKKGLPEYFREAVTGQIHTDGSNHGVAHARTPTHRTLWSGPRDLRALPVDQRERHPAGWRSTSIRLSHETTCWETSVYGPDNSPATLGCGSCASDQDTVAVDAAGDVIVTGYAWSGTEYDIKVIKYASADGAILWQTQFSGVASGIDFGIAIGVDRAGNVIVGGNVWNGTDDDMVTVKFAAADGAGLWSRTFAGAAGAGDYVFALKVDGDDNVIVTGEATASFGSTSDWTSRMGSPSTLPITSSLPGHAQRHRPRRQDRQVRSGERCGRVGADLRRSGRWPSSTRWRWTRRATPSPPASPSTAWPTTTGTR